MRAAHARWRAMRSHGLPLWPGRGIPLRGERGYFAFLRKAFTCVLRGHEEPRLLHRFEKREDKGRMMLRDACSRCGFPIEERRAPSVQFPQPRGAEYQRWRDQ